MRNITDYKKLLKKAQLARIIGVQADAQRDYPLTSSGSTNYYTDIVIQQDTELTGTKYITGLTIKNGANVKLSTDITAQKVSIEDSSFLSIQDNTVISDVNVSNGSLTCSSGGTATNLDAYTGNLTVLSGGSVTDIQLQQSSTIIISSGAYVSDLTVGSGTHLVVSSGVSVSNVNVQVGGSITILTGGYVNGLQLQNDTVYCAAQSGSYITSPQPAQLLLTASNFNGVTISSATLDTTSNVTIGSGIITKDLQVLNGNVTVTSGATMLDTVVKEGTVTVLESAVVSDIYLASGNLNIQSGASTAIVNIASSASINLQKQATVSTLIVQGGKLTLQSATVSGLQIGNADINITKGATVTSINQQGGTVKIQSGANVTETNIQAGTLYTQNVLQNAVVGSKGNIHVQSGGVAYNTIVSSGGLLYVSSGGNHVLTNIKQGGNIITENGILQNLTLQSGACYVISAGSAAQNLNIQYGATVHVLSGGSLSYIQNPFMGTIITQPFATVSNVQLSNNVFIGNKEQGLVSAYFTQAETSVASNLYIAPTMSCYVYSGGIIQSTTLAPNSYLYVQSGGTASVLSSGSIIGNIHAEEGAVVQYIDKTQNKTYYQIVTKDNTIYQSANVLKTAALEVPAYMTLNLYGTEVQLLQANQFTNINLASSAHVQKLNYINKVPINIGKDTFINCYDFSYVDPQTQASSTFIHSVTDIKAKTSDACIGGYTLNGRNQINISQFSQNRAYLNGDKTVFIESNCIFDAQQNAYIDNIQLVVSSFVTKDPQNEVNTKATKGIVMFGYNWDKNIDAFLKPYKEQLDKALDVRPVAENITRVEDGRYRIQQYDEAKVRIQNGGVLIKYPMKIKDTVTVQSGGTAVLVSNYFNAPYNVVSSGGAVVQYIHPQTSYNVVVGDSNVGVLQHAQALQAATIRGNSSDCYCNDTIYPQSCIVMKEGLVTPARIGKCGTPIDIISGGHLCISAGEVRDIKVKEGGVVTLHSEGIASNVTIEREGETVLSGGTLYGHWNSDCNKRLGLLDTKGQIFFIENVYDWKKKHPDITDSIGRNEGYKYLYQSIYDTGKLQIKQTSVVKDLIIGSGGSVHIKQDFKYDNANQIINNYAQLYVISNEASLDIDPIKVADQSKNRLLQYKQGDLLRGCITIKNGICEQLEKVCLQHIYLESNKGGINFQNCKAQLQDEHKVIINTQQQKEAFISYLSSITDLQFDQQKQYYKYQIADYKRFVDLSIDKSNTIIQLPLDMCNQYAWFRINTRLDNDDIQNVIIPLNSSREIIMGWLLEKVGAIKYKYEGDKKISTYLVLRDPNAELPRDQNGEIDKQSFQYKEWKSIVSNVSMIYKKGKWQIHAGPEALGQARDSMLSIKDTYIENAVIEQNGTLKTKGDNYIKNTYIQDGGNLVLTEVGKGFYLNSQQIVIEGSDYATTNEDQSAPDSSSSLEPKFDVTLPLPVSTIREGWYVDIDGVIKANSIFVQNDGKFSFDYIEDKTAIHSIIKRGVQYLFCADKFPTYYIVEQCQHVQITTSKPVSDLVILGTVVAKNGTKLYRPILKGTLQLQKGATIDSAVITQQGQLITDEGSEVTYGSGLCVTDTLFTDNQFTLADTRVAAGGYLQINNDISYAPPPPADYYIRYNWISVDTKGVLDVDTGLKREDAGDYNFNQVDGVDCNTAGSVLVHKSNASLNVNDCRLAKQLHIYDGGSLWLYDNAKAMFVYMHGAASVNIFRGGYICIQKQEGDTETRTDFLVASKHIEQDWACSYSIIPQKPALYVGRQAGRFIKDGQPLSIASQQYPFTKYNTDDISFKLALSTGGMSNDIVQKLAGINSDVDFRPYSNERLTRQRDAYIQNIDGLCGILDIQRQPISNSVFKDYVIRKGQVVQIYPDAASIPDVRFRILQGGRLVIYPNVQTRYNVIIHKGGILQTLGNTNVGHICVAQGAALVLRSGVSTGNIHVLGKQHHIYILEGAQIQALIYQCYRQYSRYLGDYEDYKPYYDMHPVVYVQKGAIAFKGIENKGYYQGNAIYQNGIIGMKRVIQEIENNAKDRKLVLGFYASMEYILGYGICVQTEDGSRYMEHVRDQLVFKKVNSSVELKLSQTMKNVTLFTIPRKWRQVGRDVSFLDSVTVSAESVQAVLTKADVNAVEPVGKFRLSIKGITAKVESSGYTEDYGDDQIELEAKAVFPSCIHFDDCSGEILNFSIGLNGDCSGLKGLHALRSCIEDVRWNMQIADTQGYNGSWVQKPHWQYEVGQAGIYTAGSGSSNCDMLIQYTNCVSCLRPPYEGAVGRTDCARFFKKDFDKTLAPITGTTQNIYEDSKLSKQQLQRITAKLGVPMYQPTQFLAIHEGSSYVYRNPILDTQYVLLTRIQDPYKDIADDREAIYRGEYEIKDEHEQAKVLYQLFYLIDKWVLKRDVYYKQTTKIKTQFIQSMNCFEPPYKAVFPQSLFYKPNAYNDNQEEEKEDCSKFVFGCEQEESKA